MPVRRLDQHGRTVAVENASRRDDGTDALLPTMRQHAAVARNFAVIGAILPALQRIALEHGGTLRDWQDLLAEQPLAVPPRIRSLSVGLQAGLQTEMLVAVPVLVPQLEHLLRLIVKSRGGMTTSLADDGTQKEVLLQALLGKPELSDAIGADTVFDLEGLLIDQATGNLRNLFAHGMLDDGDFFRTDSV
jgi:hypothetical protein